MKKIAIIVASLRNKSYSERIAKNLANDLANEYEVIYPAIADLAFYREEYDNGELETPKNYLKFRQEIEEAAAVIFVTPEYNRSIPAVLKNALDVASRPYGQGAWRDKTCLVVSHSVGSMAGYAANMALKQILPVLGMTTPAIELCLANTPQFIDEQGNITNEASKDLIKATLKKWLFFVEKNA